MFVEDYRELKIDNAERFERCFLFEKFVDDLLEQNQTVLFQHRETNVAIHPLSPSRL